MSAIMDIKDYERLVKQFGKLNGQLAKFINGTSEETLATDSGAIKTLAGLVKDLTSIQYTQRVFDYALKSDMDNNTEMGDGDIARLFDPAVSDNNIPIKGLYQKTIAGYVKVNYADLYDLRDQLPNPWNYYTLKFDETQTVAPIYLFTFKYQANNVQLQTLTFECEIETKCEQIGKFGTTVSTHRFMIGARPTTEGVKHDYDEDIESLSLTFDPGYDDCSKPGFILDEDAITIDGFKYVNIFLSPLYDVAEVPSIIEVRLKGFDTSKVIWNKVIE